MRKCSLDVAAMVVRLRCAAKMMGWCVLHGQLKAAPCVRAYEVACGILSESMHCGTDCLMMNLPCDKDTQIQCCRALAVAVSG